MNSSAQSRMVDLTIAGVVTVTVPILAFVVWPMIVERTAAPPLGSVLTYEIDPDFSPRGATIDFDQLVAAIDRRINQESNKLAIVRPTDDQRVEVALLRPNDADAERAKQLLASTATFEFRVLASDRFDKATIVRAMADPSKTRVRDDKGNLLAWWVPVKAGEVEALADYTDIARRTSKRDKKETTEVLVMNDPHDLTGAYLTRAEAGTDHRGRPKLILNLNSHGGQLFRDLTSSHLPDRATGAHYKLGLILNGELCSAPMIVSTIYNRAEITSSFTRQELDDIVTLLNSGSLPARIRLVPASEPRQ